jgi:hypothetical protein
MPLPVKTCLRCGKEFELTPTHMGFADRCAACQTPTVVPRPVALRELRRQKEAEQAAIMEVYRRWARTGEVPPGMMMIPVEETRAGVGTFGMGGKRHNQNRLGVAGVRGGAAGPSGAPGAVPGQ